MEEDKLQGNIRWHVQNTRVRAIMTCGCRCTFDTLDYTNSVYVRIRVNLSSPFGSQHFTPFSFFSLFLWMYYRKKSLLFCFYFRDLYYLFLVVAYVLIHLNV